MLPYNFADNSKSNLNGQNWSFVALVFYVVQNLQLQLNYREVNMIFID